MYLGALVFGRELLYVHMACPMPEFSQRLLRLPYDETFSQIHYGLAIAS